MTTNTQNSESHYQVQQMLHTSAPSIVANPASDNLNLIEPSQLLPPDEVDDLNGSGNSTNANAVPTSSSYSLSLIEPSQLLPPDEVDDLNSSANPFNKSEVPTPSSDNLNLIEPP